MSSLSLGSNSPSPEDQDFKNAVKTTQEFYPFKSENEIREYITARRTIESLYEQVAKFLERPPFLSRTQMSMTLEVFEEYGAYLLDGILVDFFYSE